MSKYNYDEDQCAFFDLIERHVDLNTWSDEEQALAVKVEFCPPDRFKEEDQDRAKPYAKVELSRDTYLGQFKGGSM